MQQLTLLGTNNEQFSVVVENSLLMSEDIPASIIKNIEPLTVGTGTLSTSFYLPNGYDPITSWYSIYTGITFILLTNTTDGKFLIIPGFYKYTSMQHTAFSCNGYFVGGTYNKPGKHISVTSILEESNTAPYPNIAASDVTAAELITAETGNPDMARTSVLNTLTGDRVKIQSTIPFLKLTLGTPKEVNIHYLMPGISTGHDFMIGGRATVSTISIPVIL